jgi:hypothetical protein
LTFWYDDHAKLIRERKRDTNEQNAAERSKADKWLAEQMPDFLRVHMPPPNNWMVQFSHPNNAPNARPPGQPASLPGLCGDDRSDPRLQ